MRSMIINGALFAMGLCIATEYPTPYFINVARFLGLMFFITMLGYLVSIVPNSWLK